MPEFDRSTNAPDKPLADVNDMFMAQANDGIANFVREQQSNGKTQAHETTPQTENKSQEKPASGTSLEEKGLCAVGIGAWSYLAATTPGPLKIFPAAALAINSYACKDAITDLVIGNKNLK